MPVNEDKKEYFQSYDIDGTAKLWEWIANFDESGTIALLLMKKWKNNKIILVGDYDESGLYDKAKNTYKHIGVSVNKLKKEKLNDFIHSKDKYVLVNNTDKTFVSGSPRQIAIMLVLLLRQSSEVGGGDIEEESEIDGLFAGKNIFVSKKSEFTDTGYKDITKDVIGPSMKFYKS
jgi:hypothetical protein